MKLLWIVCMAVVVAGDDVRFVPSDRIHISRFSFELDPTLVRMMKYGHSLTQVKHLVNHQVKAELNWADGELRLNMITFGISGVHSIHFSGQVNKAPSFEDLGLYGFELARSEDLGLHGFESEWSRNYPLDTLEIVITVQIQEYDDLCKKTYYHLAFADAKQTPTERGTLYSFDGTPKVRIETWPGSIPQEVPMPCKDACHDGVCTHDACFAIHDVPAIRIRIVDGEGFQFGNRYASTHDYSEIRVHSVGESTRNEWRIDLFQRDWEWVELMTSTKECSFPAIND